MKYKEYVFLGIKKQDDHSLHDHHIQQKNNNHETYFKWICLSFVSYSSEHHIQLYFY